MKRLLSFCFLISCSLLAFTQTPITLFPDSLGSPLSNQFQPGVFYVPKTQEAQDDFLNNGVDQNCIRTHIIESVLNNASSLSQAISLLDNVSGILQDVSQKTDRLIFIFEKMPVWLSSSSDGSPATTPGWSVLNTKPPANYADWNNMVNLLTNRIVNHYGISNASFEIWNEPDLGSWGGTKAEYFELFRETQGAIKSVSSTLPVGGPAVNHWGNDLFTQPSAGYLNYATADASLIGQLIDSTEAWGQPLDFVSWHHFNHSYQAHQNAVEYLQQKYANLGRSVPDLVVSEWNIQSFFRDTPMHRAFMIKTLIELHHAGTDYQAVAAWQDFESTPVEFHQDYGMLTYGSIHKPAYKALLLANRLSGTTIAYSAPHPVDLMATVDGDTLHLLITNYIPPAFIETIFHTLYEGKLTLNQLDSAGYLDIANSSTQPLDSLYQGLLPLPGNSPIDQAIGQSIPVYTHLDSLQTQDRTFTLNLSGYTDSYSGRSFTINSTVNNLQYVYDSLLTLGHTQASAISLIRNDQSMESRPETLQNGELRFQMEPNSVRLYQFHIPGIQSRSQELAQAGWILYPNPGTGKVFLLPPTGTRHPEFTLINSQGKIIGEYRDTTQLDLSSLAPGVYFFTFPGPFPSLRWVKLPE